MIRNFKYPPYNPKTKYKFIGVMLIALALTGCTKNFEKYNTDPTKLSSTQSVAIASTLFGPLEVNIFDDYQRAQNLSADGYAGYLDACAFNQGSNLDYGMHESWNAPALGDIYGDILPSMRSLGLTTNIKTSQPPVWGIGLLIQVTAMDKVTDRFGPVPYSKAGSSLTTTPFDSQQAIYQQFFKQIDTAVTNLQAAISAGITSAPYTASTDYVYGWNYKQWLKYANSLRLRLAMRIVKVDAVTAKAQALAAIQNSGGLLETTTDDANVPSSINGFTGFYAIATYGGGQMVMDAAIQSYMQGYNDPRFTVYFAPTTAAPTGSSPYAGQYHGVRTGTYVSDNATYAYFSTGNIPTSTNPNTYFTPSFPQPILTSAEVWFLRAEAALRGWTSENVQTDYETGIRNSMTKYGVTSGVDAYIAGTTTEANYVDPLVPANNATALSTISVAWNPNGTKEQMLEQIITQKWLALFPDGQEAWADYRRTGYPKLFPIINNDSGIPGAVALQIRRLQYPSSLILKDPAAFSNAVANLLNGPDNITTRLWWDVNAPNF